MKTILFSICLLLTLSGVAQSVEIPTDYKLVKAEDYAPYEQDIIQCAEWLLRTAPNEEQEKQGEALKFIITWVTGSPTVSIGITPNIVTFMETSPNLLGLYLAAYTSFCIKNNSYKDAAAANLSAINSLIDYYQKYSKQLEKDKNMDEYVKMKKKGKLEAYIKENSIN